MKSILISIKPKWVAKILNGEKTIEVRKGTALYKATQKLIDEYGYAEFFVYCTKDGELFYDPITKKWLSLKSRNIKKVHRLSNGAVKFKFRCYKVEHFEREYLSRYIDDYYYDSGEPLNKKFYKQTCLTEDELFNYIGGKGGCAIHISDLEIFDKPKELSEFKSYKKNIVNTKINGMVFETELDNSLTKAPQSFCYVEVK